MNYFDTVGGQRNMEVIANSLEQIAKHMARQTALLEKLVEEKTKEEEE